MNEKEKILEILASTYPDAKPALNYRNEFELLVATMLSAQSTDEQVNKVTDILFQQVKSPTDIINLSIEEVEFLIKGCGLYRTKAKNLKKTCELLVEKYNSKVPADFEEIITLPGVGRKTANVVLSNAFDIPAIGVDTHVFRVSNRLGLTINAKNPLDSELQLQKVIPKKDWKQAHHWLIFHGRRVCKARKPNCKECNLHPWCLAYGREN